MCEFNSSEKTQDDSKTLSSDNSDEISPMDETPVGKSLEIENSMPKFDSCDEILGMEETPFKVTMDFGNSSDDIVAQMDETLDIGNSSDVVAQMNETLDDFGGIVRNDEFKTEVLDCCNSGGKLSGCSMIVEDDSQIVKTLMILETRQSENPVSDSCETAGIGKSVVEIPEIMRLENGSSDCCQTDGIVGGSLEIDDAQVTKSVEEIPENTQLGNPVLDCCETGGIVGGSLVIDDAQIMKSDEEIPKTMQFGNPVLDCCETGGIVGGSLVIDDAQVKIIVEEIQETTQLGNSVLDCCETGGILSRSVVIGDGEVPKSVEEIPGIKQLGNPVLVCCETGGIVGGSLVIADVQAAKSVEEMPETMQFGNPVSDCGETGGIGGGSPVIGDAQVVKSIDGIPETMQLGNPVLDCCETGEIVGGSLVINDVEVGDVQLGKTLEECNIKEGEEVENFRFDDTPALPRIPTSNDDDDDDDDEYIDYDDEYCDMNNACVFPKRKMHYHGYSAGKNVGLGCLSNENDFKFGGMVGPLRDDWPSHCDCLPCFNRKLLQNHCDCGESSDREDDCRIMGVEPHHSYLNHPHMTPFPRNGDGFGLGRRCLSMREKQHHHLMKTSRYYRVRYYESEGRFMGPDCMDGEVECYSVWYATSSGGNHRFRLRRDPYYREWYETRGRFKRPCYMDREAGESYFYGKSYMNRWHYNMESESDRNPNHYSSWSEPEPCPVGAGLFNLGNTCFLNAIIQCFTHTVPLVEGLQSLKHDASSHGQDEFCVLCAVRHQIEQSIALSGKITSPSNLVDNLNHISSDFRRYQQEDAHDFLMSLLDKLDMNWSKHEGNAAELSSPPDSLVNQVFGGRLVSQLSCCKCRDNSDSYEPLIDLSLEIEDVDDLECALKSFTKVETLQDITCDNCKEKVVKEKQLLLDQAPPVAALHLKRFKSDGIRVEKIDRMVKYPLDLDLRPYTKGVIDDDNEVLKYELYGFVVHVGLSSISGHYFCYIRTSPDAWYRFDDSKVTKVTESAALAEEAYILFYARKGTPWFSDLLDKWKTNLEEKQNTSPKSVLNTTNLPSTSFHDSDKIDLAHVSSAEPLSCVKPDEVDKEIPMPANISCFTSSSEHIHDPMQDEVLANKDTSEGVNPNDESQMAKFETCSMSNVENSLIGDPKFDDDVDINPCISNELGNPDMRSDETRIAKLETCSMSNVENSLIGDPKFDDDDVDINPCISNELGNPDMRSDETRMAKLETCSMSNVENSLIGDPKFDDDVDINPCISDELGNPDMRSDNPNDETGRAKLEICSMSGVENVALAGSKFCDDMNINPCTSPKPGSADMPSDNEEPDAEQVTCQIPLDHLKIQVKAPLSVKGRLGKAKQYMERKEAAKYVKLSMPCARRRILMGYLSGNRVGRSRKRRNQAGFIHRHSPKKRVKLCPKRSLVTVAATV